MRVMVLVKATEDSESGLLPTRAAMEDMDSDGDGQIEFNEFVAWMDRQQS